jgi:hypothetical protein
MTDCLQLLATLRNDSAVQDWACVCVSLNTAFGMLSADAKATLFECDEFLAALVEVIAKGVSDSNRHCAWGAACSCMVSFLTRMPPSKKSSLARSHLVLVESITSCLQIDGAHSCWRDGMELLKQLVCREASLSHINLCTLSFLKADSGLMAFLVRCSRRLSSEADSVFFLPAFQVLRCMSRSINPCFLSVAPDVLALFIVAAQVCTEDGALRNALCALSNFSEIIEYCSVLDQVNCFEFAVSHISGMPASAAEWNDGGSVANFCLSIIVNMCRNTSLHEKLKKLHVIEILTPLAVATCAAEVRVLMALSYVIGCKENISDSSFVSNSAMSHFANAASIGKIVDCLENTLNLRGGPGYTFGYIVMPAILQVCPVLTQKR